MGGVNFEDGQAWELAKKALLAGKFTEVEELIPHMVKSDQLLMRAKLKIARDASAISAKEGA